MFIMKILLGVLAFAITHKLCYSSSSSYIGAVVEYRPVTNGKDGRQVAEKNAAHFDTIVKTATEYNVDIIVFPEIGLTSLPENRNWTIEKIRAHHYYAASYIPDPEKKIVLCDAGNSYSKSLQSISCSAKEYKMYVVVNHHEKVDCPKAHCAPDNFLLYNTNVVFDREGRLIARYRKYNLFNEPGINITARPEISTFRTDFDVEFGQIVCNDILYVEPSLEIVKNTLTNRITDVVYSAEWFSELPFLTSVEIHSAWAYANDVNLLSSGFNEPTITNGGSGIYLGRKGIAKATIPNVYQNALIVTEIPKIINGHRQQLSNKTISIVYKFSQAEVPTSWDDSKNFMYKDDFDLYTTELVDKKSSQRSKSLCNRGLCCAFKFDVDFDENLANTNGTDYYRYRIGVFNGVRMFAGLFTVGIEVCGLFFCRNDNLKSCGERFDDDVRVIEPTSFRSIAIKRNSDNEAKKFYLPISLTKNLLPIDTSKISFEIYTNENNKSKIMKMTLNKSEDKLRSFAIYGRNLAKDRSELTTSSN